MSFCCQLHLRCGTLRPAEVRFFLGYRNTWAEPCCRIIPLAGRMREFWVQTLVSKRGNDESQQRLWQQQEPCTLLLSNKGTKRKFLVQKLLKCPSKESFILLASHKSKPFPFLDQSLPPALRSRFCQDLFFFFFSHSQEQRISLGFYI